MMLNRKDYAQVSGANKGILSLVPNENRQDLIIGDSSGSLSLYSLGPSQAIPF